MVDLDPQALLSKGLSPLDVSNAVNAQNLTLPTGTTKIGKSEFIVDITETLPRARQAARDWDPTGRIEVRS